MDGKRKNCEYCSPGTFEVDSLRPDLIDVQGVRSELRPGLG